MYLSELYAVNSLLMNAMRLNNCGKLKGSKTKTMV